MKLRSITLNNVRRFTEPAKVAGLGDGLNVLCEPNEHGKSTLFDAIQALFFKPHGSRDKEVSSLRPHAGGAPEVTVELETADGHFTLSKRWLQRPSATVHQGGRLIAQADAAEAWIADLLGGEAGGPSGLIWVRQGVTDLTAGTTKERQAALEARRDLMTSVGDEVEAMTGGRRMDRALARCRDELSALATGTGKPKTGGAWKAAIDTVEALTEQEAALSATARDLHDALAERKRARRDLAEWDAPDAVAERSEKLETARAAHAAAMRHAEELDAAARRVDMARLTAEATRGKLASLRAAQTERAEAARQVEATGTEKLAAAAARDKAQATRDAAQKTFDAAEAALSKAEATRNAAQRAEAARDGAERRNELENRIAQAEEMRRRMETAAGAARNGPDATALRRIETLANAHAAAIAARDATATQIIAHYVAGSEGAIRFGDAALPGEQTVPLARTTRLDIAGVGHLEIRPGDTGHDTGTVDAAAKALRTALAAAGAETLEDARDAAAARNEAERQHAEAKAVLQSLAPDGIEQLRAALCRITVPVEGENLPDLAQAEADLAAARGARDIARSALDTATERLADARAEVLRADTALTSLQDRLTRAEDAVARTGGATEDELASELAVLEAALAEVQAAHAAKAKDAPDPANARAALTRAESVETRARDETARLKLLLARLEERIGRSSGEAVEERLAETTEKLTSAREALARIEHEVAVLRRLEQALETARNEARDRYFAPIARELKPLLHLLWPDAELTWGEESLLPDALLRDGQSEPVDILSGGTQEQVALLVRLAFARMLSHAGRTAPVILDDALVFTDDDRIERMFDALHRQAGDLQIIVLTCRQRAFRDLGGHALSFAAVAPEDA